MSTQLFFIDDSAMMPVLEASNPNGAKKLSTGRGAGATSVSCTTVAGPTAGVQLGGATLQVWLSPPLAADVTIAGAIVKNLHGNESNMNANATFDIKIDRCDPLGAFISQIQRVEYGAELGTGETTCNWSTGTVTSTNMKKGDRIKVTIYANDATSLNMGSGYSFIFDYGGAAGATGDSYITFNETFSFLDPFAPTTEFWLGDAAADAALDAYLDKYLTPTQPSDAVTAVRNEASGPTGALQYTKTAGGTLISWWSKPLNGVTIPAGSVVSASVLMKEQFVSDYVCANVQVYKTAANGSSPVTICSATYPRELGTVTGTPEVWLMQVASQVVIASGERLHVVMAIDDVPIVGSMAGVGVATLQYGGSATWDTKVGFEQAITEKAGFSYVQSFIA